MTKTEIKKALELVQRNITHLQNWLTCNHTNPYFSAITADVRHFEAEEKKLLRLDAETYPTMQEAKAYTDKELLLLMRTLPRPRNVPEKDVHAFVTKRIKEYTTV